MRVLFQKEQDFLRIVDFLQKNRQKYFRDYIKYFCLFRLAFLKHMNGGIHAIEAIKIEIKKRDKSKSNMFEDIKEILRRMKEDELSKILAYFEKK